MAAASSSLYPNSQVKKAGKLWARFLRVYRAEGAETAGAEFDMDDVLAADQVIGWWRAQHAYPLRMANANLRYYVRDYEDSRVAQRLKKHSTIVDKLVRQPTMDLTRMEDIGGCRVILPTQREVDIVVRKLRKNWNRTVTRHRDYVAEPKPDGYRAHHLVVTKSGWKIEVQIRTQLQDFWANTVEYDSRTVRVDLKSGHGPDDVKAYYVAMADVLAHQDRGEPAPQDLMHRVQDLYSVVGPYLTRVPSPPNERS